MNYKQIVSMEPFDKTSEHIQLIRDDSSVLSFPVDPANIDYQQYLAWLAEGNTPEPADNTE